MMRHKPENKEDWDELSKLGAADWQSRLLTLNPDYVFWGPGEDFMCDSGRQYKSWSDSLYYDSWEEFNFGLDDLNECVNFYFELDGDKVGKPITVSLTLWILHPRKGAARGIRIHEIKQSDLREVQEFLLEARDRNAKRFRSVGAVVQV